MLGAPRVGLKRRGKPFGATRTGEAGWSFKQPGLAVDIDFANNRAENNGARVSPASLLTTARTTSNSLASYAEARDGRQIAFANNIPRITDKGLLVEEARTNIQGFSSDFTQVTAWSALSNVSIGTAIIAPDGTVTAQKIQDSNTTNAPHAVIGAGTIGTITAGATITYSGLFKSAEYNQVSIVIKDAATFTDGFHLTLDTNTGAISGTGLDGAGTFVSASSVVYPNGWVRVQATGTLNGSTTAAKLGIYLKTFSGYVGVVGNGLYGWQQQIEAGPFASSIIPTPTNASVTRNADVIALISPPVFGTALTIFGTGTPFAPTSYGANQVLLDASDGTTSQRISNVRQAGVGIANFFDGGTNVGAPGAFGVWAQNVVGSSIQAYAPSSQAASFNGASVTTSANTGFPTGLNRISIGANGSGTAQWNGLISRIAVWPTLRLGDSELVSLTGGQWWFSQAGLVLDMDFVSNTAWSNGAIVSPASRLLSVNRGLAAVSDTLAGDWIQFAPNVARITNKGLLIEEQRTNSLRNNSMQGAVSGSPGTPPTSWSIAGTGLTRTIVGTGTENGIDYIDVRLQNAAANAAFFGFEVADIIAAQNQVWSLSMFAKVIGGSLTNITPQLTLDRLDSGHVNLSGGDFQTVTLGISSAALGTSRVQMTRTAIEAATAFVTAGFRFIATGAYDVTVRIGWPQFERGAIISSPIRTTNAALTRPGEVVTLAVPPTFGPSITIAASVMYPFAPPAGTFPAVIEITKPDGNNSNRIYIESNGPLDHRVGVISGGVPQWDVNSGGSVVVGTTEKWSIAVAPSDFASAFNGNLGATQASGSLPSGLNQLYFGSIPTGGNYANAYIRRFGLWPSRRLTGAELQAVTT